ncbi:MAG: M48 family metallopeptidase [Bacteroidota bacterium]
MTFHGKYFNGRTSAGYAATVTIGHAAIYILYSDGATSETIEWAPQKIHPNDFAENGKVILKYGDYPFQYLEVNDTRFTTAIKQAFPEAKFHKTTLNFIFSTGFMGLLVLAVACIGLLALSYFVLLPAAAEQIAVRVPVEWEKQLGDAAYGQMVSEETKEAENTKRMNEFFRLLNYKTGYKVEITVIKDDVVNAFALPGGKIIVYEGILRKMDNYSELTALLSHEFSHVELKHSTKNIFRSLSSYLLLSVLLGDVGGITAVVIQNAYQLKQLGYSRTLEEEADRNGLKLMKQRKIDPQGMIGLFEALKQEERGGEMPQFLSTHPLTTERINSVKKDIIKHNYQIVEDGQLDSLWHEIKRNLDN